MKNHLLLLLICVFSYNSYSQQNESAPTEKVWRVNFLNPAMELEVPTSSQTTLSAALGVGFGGGYRDLTYGGSGFIYIIAPFLDVQEKWLYNRDKRSKKNKNTESNSGDFISLRFITRGNSLADNVSRTSNFDFAIGPTWGIQRKYGKSFHFLFDLGPQYYFDTNGNGNFWPLMVQLNLGFDLKKKS